MSDVASNGNAGPLEFPASPTFSGNSLYVSNFDIARGANMPNDPGIGASIARLDVGVSGLPSAQASAPATATPAAPNTPSSASTPSSVVTPPATPVATLTAVTVVGAPVVTTSPTNTGGGTLIPVDTPVPVGMPRTGAPESLLPMLEALGGILVLAGLPARTARSRAKAHVRVERDTER